MNHPPVELRNRDLQIAATSVYFCHDARLQTLATVVHERRSLHRPVRVWPQTRPGNLAVILEFHRIAERIARLCIAKQMRNDRRVAHFFIPKPPAR